MTTSSTGYASSRIAIPIDTDVWAAEWYTEVDSMLYGAGPGAWKMDEKAYWEALRSYTVEVFSWWGPDELKKKLEILEQNIDFHWPCNFGSAKHCKDLKIIDTNG